MPKLFAMFTKVVISARHFHISNKIKFALPNCLIQDWRMQAFFWCRSVGMCPIGFVTGYRPWELMSCWVECSQVEISVCRWNGLIQCNRLLRSSLPPLNLQSKWLKMWTFKQVCLQSIRLRSNRAFSCLTLFLGLHILHNHVLIKENDYGQANQERIY